ncbi:MAG: putative hydrolase of HD superfamily [Planctomycetota bacterium]|jgi:putative hydrolase of HD superfamily
MQATLEALLKLHVLESLPRTGWVQRGVPSPESVAGHVVGVGFLALALAPRVEPGLDVDRVVSLALVHDAPEALTGDLPKSGSELLPAGAKRKAEMAAAKLLLDPCNSTAMARFEEFEAQNSREARFAKLCDKLQLGVQLLAYVRSGQRGLEEFMGTVAATDCSEFAVAKEFQQLLLLALANAAE